MRTAMKAAAERAAKAQKEDEESQATANPTMSPPAGPVPAPSLSPQQSAAQRQWELSNNVEITSDAHWAPDHNHMNQSRQVRPWQTNYKHFTNVKISALAAVKMLIHSRRGSPNPAAGQRDWFEVMGLMMGHFYNDTMIVTDTFGLPVNASEVECSMNENSQIYMVDYLTYHRRGGKADKGCIGWYHSHPGYTCFLSGIDVNTQQLNQQTEDPWVAVVVDPVRTIATGKMDIKAFRTFPESYAATLAPTEHSSEVIKRYGIHAHRYYELPITIVRSNSDAKLLDALLGQYWAMTFSTNPLLANRAFNTSQIEQTTQVVRLVCGCHNNNNRLAARNRSNKKAGDDDAEEEQFVYEAKVGALTPLVIDRGDGAALEKGTGQQQPPGSKVGTSSSSKKAVYADVASVAAEILQGGIQLAVKDAVFSAGLNTATTNTEAEKNEEANVAG